MFLVQCYTDIISVGCNLKRNNYYCIWKKNKIFCLQKKCINFSKTITTIFFWIIVYNFFHHCAFLIYSFVKIVLNTLDIEIVEGLSTQISCDYLNFFYIYMFCDKRHTKTYYFWLVLIDFLKAKRGKLFLKIIQLNNLFNVPLD